MIAQKDCTARRIVKDETQGEATIGQTKEDCDEDLVDETEGSCHKECSKEGPVDGENDEGGDLDDDEENKEGSQFELYAQRRERNIMENKRLFDEVKAKYLWQETKKKNKRCVLCHGNHPHEYTHKLSPNLLAKTYLPHLRWQL